MRLCSSSVRLVTVCAVDFCRSERRGGGLRDKCRSGFCDAGGGDDQDGRRDRGAREQRWSTRHESDNPPNSERRFEAEHGLEGKGDKRPLNMFGCPGKRTAFID